LIDENLSKLAKYMPEVTNYNSELNALSERWNLLTLLGQMSNLGMDMSKTREQFEGLTEQLLIKLSEERLKKLTSEMKSKAQVAVDIVIRNLFERTADIGFLATDDDIREYLLHLEINNSGDDEYRQKKAQLKKALIARFNEYVAKYSVYYNIVLMGKSGEVLAQLDQSNTTTHSRSPFVNDAILSSSDYVEFYGYSDLDPTKEKSLVYAYKVTKTNAPDSEVIGVLALFFKFEDEMSGIFSNLLEENDWMNILILDSSSRVISSSDPYQIPTGALMQKVLNDDYKIVRFGGREYLAKTCRTNGYQGFFGLDWMGHAMIPLENAFAPTSETKLPSIPSNVLDSVMQNSNLFGDELITIPKEAHKIQKELDITVWNGNAKIANSKTSDNSFGRSLLVETSKTGSKTKTIFENSIGNLNFTVISSILNDVTFLAKLAIDIMDRNLYERANDCRWWALTTYFRKSLKSPESNTQEICDILAYINNLYTVYTNLFIYNSDGVVIAVSNEEEKSLIGNKINDEWVKHTLNIKESQKYSVSSFKKTSLYANRHTYIYSASITDIENKDEVLGGIGIVFDSQEEFRAMLLDTLPKNRDGEVSQNYFALFCNRDKTVISSTNEELQPGDSINISDDFFNLENGDSYANIIEYKQKYYSVGSSLSKGYREYKVHDDYVNDIIAIVFVQISSSIEPPKSETKNIKKYSYNRPQPYEETTDISTFFLGESIYGIESKYIVSSLSNQSLTKIIGCNDYFIGVINYNKQTIGIVALYSLITSEKFEYNEKEHDIILLSFEHEGKTTSLGIAIDSIYDSPEIANKDLQSYANYITGSDTLTKFVVKPEDDIHKEELLSILDVQAIYNKMTKYTKNYKNKSQK